MSGLIAIRGFDYQATVILDLLLDHFGRHDDGATARPEGRDDLDLFWDASAAQRRHVQIKKPREDADGNRRPSRWLLSEACDQLLPNTLGNLATGDAEQWWVLGDELDQKLSELLDSGQAAPATVPSHYWTAVHLLARQQSFRTLSASERTAMLRFVVPKDLPADPDAACRRIMSAFEQFAAQICTTPRSVVDHHARAMTDVHAGLPGALERTVAKSTFGAEHDVAGRVFDRLERTYGLPRQVVEHTLFRNLRGFINDVSKMQGRTFDREEFELELRSVWPTMVAVTEPPPLVPGHVRRDALAARLIPVSSTVLEVTGVSGAGKTGLAGEAIERVLQSAHASAPLYAEVRGDTSLRDVLAGVAFTLRRFGLLDPFRIAIRPNQVTEALIADLASSFAALPVEQMLMIDLVQGSCSETFARDLATFVRHLSGGTFRLTILGQERALRVLSDFEREQLGVSGLDVRGFDYEEFVSFVHYHHPGAPRDLLWDMFGRLTLGRQGGLLPGVAAVIARAETTEAMAAIARTSPERMLPYAEEQRWGRLTLAARSAAEKLCCFALPFDETEAEAAFPTEPCGLALRELVRLGLLRPLGEDRYELHEIVRAGLEEIVPRPVRMQAHAVLAAYYAQRQLPMAEILHLRRAGLTDQAHARARSVFLEGRHWGSLAALMTANDLVTASEIIELVSRPVAPDAMYLVPDLLAKWPDPETADRLLAVMRSDPGRLARDFNWGSALVETVLSIDPQCFFDLVSIALGSETGRTDARFPALDTIRVGARRVRPAVDERTLRLFAQATSELQTAMAPLLLLDHRREVLKVVFSALAAHSHSAGTSVRRRRDRVDVRVAGLDEAVEFLAAIPPADPATMLTARSSLLGFLEPVVWSNRTQLVGFATALLSDQAQDEVVLEGALRTLAFLGERAVLALSEPLLSRAGRLGTVAAIVPALLHIEEALDRSISRVLDRGLPFSERVTALGFASLLGADLGGLYTRLAVLEGEAFDRWDAAFLLFCQHAPFDEALPLIERELGEPTSSRAGMWRRKLLLMALVRLQCPAATDLLVRALTDVCPAVRSIAALSLSRRRSRRALPALRERLAIETSEVAAVSLFTAVVASGPLTLEPAFATSVQSPTVDLWRTILAGRLRDEGMGTDLVRQACDASANWQIRRAAILAAGRLPFDRALDRIAPLILAERSTLTDDEDVNLVGHLHLAWLVMFDPAETKRVFGRGRAAFVLFFAEVLDQLYRECLTADGHPSGADSAAWLFDRLEAHGWARDPAAPDRVANELHVPTLQAAVLRSLRLCGRLDLLEEQVATADHPWLAIRSIMERVKAGGDDGLRSRLENLVEGSPQRGHPVVVRIIADVCGRPGEPASPPPALPEADTPRARLGYADALRLLDTAGQCAGVQPAEALLFEVLSREKFEDLVRRLDPREDFDTRETRYEHSVSFTPDGYRIARQVTSYRNDHRRALRDQLRPALAAANVHGLPVEWHAAELGSYRRGSYVERFLAALGRQGDPARLYDELAKDAAGLMPGILVMPESSALFDLVDDRMLPYMSDLAQSGPNHVLKGLCVLASRIERPSIDGVLGLLFQRFCGRFAPGAAALPGSEDHDLWRAFHLIVGHARFNKIPDWGEPLSRIAAMPLSWYLKDEVIRVLGRDPRSYLQIETLLFRASNFTHFYHDEIERLDALAESLFAQVLET